MPRIKKVKFKDDGTYQHDTTFTAFVTLDLYYDSKSSYFYFERKDIIDKIKTIKCDWHDLNINFRNCKRESDAIDKITFLMKEWTYFQQKKFLFVYLEADVEKSEEDVSFKYNYNSNDKEASLKIKFGKAIELTHPRTGKSIKCVVNDNWKLKDYSLYDSQHRFHFIEWTQEREDTLYKATKTLSDIGRNIFRMFKTQMASGTLGDFLESSSNLLNQNNN